MKEFITNSDINGVFVIIWEAINQKHFTLQIGYLTFMNGLFYFFCDD